MLASGGDVLGEERKYERRTLKACLHCKRSKRQCENVRPCCSCIARGLECKEKSEHETCILCRQNKLKCDKRRPCGRCIKLQLGAECQPWIHIIQADNNQKRRVRRQPDAAMESGYSSSSLKWEEKAPSPIVNSNKRRKLDPSTAVPNAAALINHASFLTDQSSGGTLPSVPSIASLEGGQKVGAAFAPPQISAPFAQDGTRGWSQTAAPTGAAAPWSKDILMLLKALAAGQSTKTASSLSSLSSLSSFPPSALSSFPSPSVPPLASLSSLTSLPFFASLPNLSFPPGSSLSSLSSSLLPPMGAPSSSSLPPPAFSMPLPGQPSRAADFASALGLWNTGGLASAVAQRPQRLSCLAWMELQYLVP